MSLLSSTVGQFKSIMIYRRKLTDNAIISQRPDKGKWTEIIKQQQVCCKVGLSTLTKEYWRKVCQYVILEVIIAWKTTQNFERSEEVDHQMMDNAKLTRTKEYFNEQVDLTLVWEMMPMSCLNRLISELLGYTSTHFKGTLWSLVAWNKGVQWGST